MNDKTFYECLERWKNSNGYTKFWGELAEKFGYVSGEQLRNLFKKERKRRGVSKESLLNRSEPQIIKTTAKILLFDIETSPINALVWGLWDQNINPDAIIQDWHLLSWSAKWLFDDEIMSDVLMPSEASEHDDCRIAKSIWKLLDEADITISHNGDKFDCKRLNTRFLYNGLPPVSHYQSVDTLVVAKNVFSFTSNKLDYINEFLGLPKKSETNFDLWKRAYFGDPEALETLSNYNNRDTEILEDLFLKLRPYIRNFPNLNLWSEENVSVCPNCGSQDLMWVGKFYYTYTGRYKAFRCGNCGAVGRSRQMDLDKEKRKTIVR